MLRIKLKKSTLIKTIIAIVSLSLVIPATAAANHQHTQLGDQPIYGHFGQPHGYVISGDFTFTAVHGKVDRVVFDVVKPTDINKSLGHYTQTSITPGSGGDNYYNLVWNSSGFQDGEYWLFGYVESDTATPNGWRDTIFHYDGTNHLRFSVNNPEAESPKPTQPPEDGCNSKLENAKKIAGQIYDKQKSNLLFIDNFFQQTSLFYEKNAPEPKTNDKTFDQVSAARKEASDSLVKLDKLNDFTCQGSLKQQVQSYLQQTTDTKNKLDNYKDSVINLIVKVLEDLK
jgi:hypothetical protein